MRRLMMCWIAKLEDQLGESLPHLRDICRASLGAFLKFLLFLPLAGHRRVLSKEASHAARIAAMAAHGCGACLQIVVNVALAAGVEPAIVEAAIKGQVENLDPAVAAAFEFADCVARGHPDADEHRDKVVAYWGAEGLAELALAVSAAGVFPTLRRAMGHGTACHAVRLCGVEMAIGETLSVSQFKTAGAAE